MARSDTNKELLGEKSSVSLKVAATYSPTMQRSPIGDAVSPLRCSPPSPARRRRAQPTPRMAPSALSASLLSPRAAGAHTARPTPSATADTARASEAGLAMSNAG